MDEEWNMAEHKDIQWVPRTDIRYSPKEHNCIHAIAYTHAQQTLQLHFTTHIRYRPKVRC